LPVPIVNLVIEWHPERLERVLLCAHYDTRPFPDRDPKRPRGRFIGANDGGSGVALLMELGRHMPAFQGPTGVDFVLFDGEEFVFDEQRDREYYFVGSNHFARDYRGSPPRHRYRWGVLLDMVADAHLDLYQEKNSLRYARPLVNQIWNTASRLGINEFIRQSGYELRDDHIPLNEIAKIPTCDLIDFDYPRRGTRQSYWHTEADTLDKCSATSLAKVGWVVLEWLHTMEPGQVAPR
jgi:Zn-dependent M28 family amino/carboxypeptidase